jgi:hypothetical protein
MPRITTIMTNDNPGNAAPTARPSTPAPSRDSLLLNLKILSDERRDGRVAGFRLIPFVWSITFRRPPPLQPAPRCPGSHLS